MKNPQPPAIFTTQELNRMMDRIKIQISNVVTEEISKKAETIREAHVIVLRLMKMDNHDWMSVHEASRMFEIGQNEFCAKVLQAGIPYMDTAGIVRRGYPESGNVPYIPAAVDKVALLMLGQTFNTDKSRAYRELLASAMLHKMHDVLKI